MNKNKLLDISFLDLMSKKRNIFRLLIFDLYYKLPLPEKNIIEKLKKV